MSLGEQIAVLDGLTIAPGDGSHGGGASYPDSGRWPLLPSSGGLNARLGAHNDLEAFAAATYPADLPNVAPKKRVFASPSGSANYGGGSSYPDDGRFPTWSQPAGMAGFGATGYKYDLPNVAPKKRVFASPSGSANYGGGSSYPDDGRFPTWSQPAGMAGLGACGCQLNGMGVLPNVLGGFGTLPNYLPPGRVFASAPQGANYSGGSTYPDGVPFPLLSSTIGLAGGFGAARRSMMPVLPVMTREQLMAAIQLHSQQMVNAKQAMTLNAPAATRQQIARTYYHSLIMLCLLRSKAGLPTLPECQKLVARMQAGAKARRNGR